MASALEHFVNNVTSFTSQGKYIELVKYISKSNEVLAKNVSHLDTVLATLQPSIHTLGVLAVLKVRLQHTSHTDTNIDTLHATVAEFINVCNEEQIRYAADMMGELCSYYSELLIAGKCAMRGLEVLKTAIIKCRETPSHLTSIYAHLVHLCLISKCFKPALQFLDVDLMDISKENGYYDVKHFLLYYYYGGMIYTAVKNFRRAQYFFQVCISTPALAVSLIMLEAYKKYTLVSLILDGKPGKIPKYVSLVFSRVIKPVSQPYMELEVAYSTHNPDVVTSVLNKHQEVFVRDQNLGLVKQCIQALYKKNIQRLTKTFLTLSLADVANRARLRSPQEAQNYILHMIEEEEIYASINQRDGMVVFLDNPEKYNSPSMLQCIHKELENSMAIQRQLNSMEEDIMVNPKYVRKLLGPSEDDGAPPSQSSSASQTPTSASLF